MYAKTLDQAVKTWAQKNGEYVSLNKSVKYQRRARTYTTLDPEKSKAILKSSNISLSDICEIKLTEESIKAKLGEVKGNQVISELIEAGATKSHKVVYWRMQVK